MTRTLINPKEVSCEHNITKYAASEHKCLQENGETLLMGKVGRLTASLMFCQRRKRCDLLKIRIHFKIVRKARGVGMTHSSSEKKILLLKSFSFKNKAPVPFPGCLVAGVMSQSTWESCRPEKHWVWEW